MDWEEFSEKLLGVVLQLAERTYLVLSDSRTGRFTVQMVLEDDHLHTHCSILRLDLNDPAVTTRLNELGWDGEDEYADPMYYWVQNLDLPAMSSEYRKLVTNFIATMREVQGVESPEQLRYRAWRDPERIPDGVLYYEEDLEALDPGENPLLLDLGIPFDDKR